MKKNRKALLYLLLLVLALATALFTLSGAFVGSMSAAAVRKQKAEMAGPLAFGLAFAYVLLIAILYLLAGLLWKRVFRKGHVPAPAAFIIGCLAVIIPRSATSGVRWTSTYEILEILLVGVTGLLFGRIYRAVYR